MPSQKSDIDIFDKVAKHPMLVVVWLGTIAKKMANRARFEHDFLGTITKKKANRARLPLTCLK